MRKAVIMAGGFGTRLRPLTCNIPKPMVPMMNRPMMEHIVNLLKKHSITDIVSLLFFQPEKITSYFGSGGNFGISMKYVEAVADYGTAGSVKNAYQHLDERFIVISGDVLTDFDISAALKFHEEKGAKATIILTQAQNPLQFGIVMTSPDGAITRFLEKPSWGEVFSDTINTGIYILEPDVLDLIPYQKEFDFSKDLFPLMLKNGMPLYGYTATGYWQDVGNLNQYQEAHYDALKGKVQVELLGEQRGQSFISYSANVASTAKLMGTVVVGENVSVGEYAEITDSVLGDDSVISAGAKITNSVLWSGVRVGERAEMTNDVICSGTSIGEKATIAENVFISDNCDIGEHAQLLSNIKLWPNRSVEEGAMLAQSLVQEEKWLRELFTDARITGISNIEMNPEFGAKFGAALGHALGADTRIVASRDSNSVSRIMKRAITAGLMSVGVDVLDLQVTPLALTRQELASGAKQVAGIHIRMSPYYPDQLDVIVLNADGRDISTSRAKSIERLFFGEDIKRVPSSDVGSMYFPERTFEAYLSRYTGALDMDVVTKRKFNVVVDYSYGMSASLFPRILGELRSNVMGLNGYIDSMKYARSEDEFANARGQMSKIISSLHYEIGFMIDPSAEKITVFDEFGTMYNQSRMLSIVTKLFVNAHRDREPYKIAVPVSAPGDIEQILYGHDVEIVRIKDSHTAMMDATKDKSILFVGGSRGRFIFTDFFFASDGMFSVGKVLELLALNNTTISAVHQEISHRYQHHTLVSCPWERKGAIMRKAMEYSEGKERQLIDGVKIFEDTASVLLLPDREFASFHVVGEGDSDDEARSVAARFSALVEQWRSEH